MPTEQLPRGSNLQLFIGKQSAFKTPAAGDNLTTFAYSFGMAESRPYQDDPILGTPRQNDRDSTEPSQDVASFAGPIVVPLDFSHLRYWLELLLGAPSTSGTEPNFVHTFTSGALVLPEPMRLPATWAICALLSAPLAAPAASAALIHVATAQNAILCLGPADLEQANRPAIAKSQERLRSLRCMRTEPGIPITVLDGPRIGGPWRVRVFPQGISGGVTMWGYPSAFVTPNGSQLIRSIQVDR